MIASCLPEDCWLAISCAINSAESLDAPPVSHLLSYWNLLTPLPLLSHHD